MKNIVKCHREFIAYFNALETTSVIAKPSKYSNYGNSKGSKKMFLHMSVLNVVCCLPLHAHHQDVLMEANMQFVHTTTDLQKFNS